MNPNLRQFFHASLRRVRFPLFRVGTDQLSASSDAGAPGVSQARVVVQATPPRPQPMQDVIAVLERVNHRLDAIEAKIDLLLVPIETTTH